MRLENDLDIVVEDHGRKLYAVYVPKGTQFERQFQRTRAFFCLLVVIEHHAKTYCGGRK